MSIKAIAKEVYICQSRVHKLEDQLQHAQHTEKTKLQDELRQARAELKVLKNMIEGRKAQSADKLRPFTFNR